MEQKTYTFKDAKGLTVIISEDELIDRCKAQNIFPLIEEGTVVCQITFSHKIPIDNEMINFIKELKRASYDTIDSMCHIDVEVFGYSVQESKEIQSVLLAEKIKENSLFLQRN